MTWHGLRNLLERGSPEVGAAGLFLDGHLEQTSAGFSAAHVRGLGTAQLLLMPPRLLEHNRDLGACSASRRWTVGLIAVYPMMIHATWP